MIFSIDLERGQMRFGDHDFLTFFDLIDLSSASASISNFFKKSRDYKDLCGLSSGELGVVLVLTRKRGHPLN
ncbi:hypothetical protein L6452_33401 [Arctium lappa]|uniref:Uncharacterized protein n=1 Tax=Arctium lappa TaxID=4217 RepID=A0ACB8YFZ9_ARCLA|nr:hypothetical protein L6452_33401 [Arctium lappa]